MPIKKVYVAGHTGMVGSAITELLKKKKISVVTKPRKQLDLTNQAKVYNFLYKTIGKYPLPEQGSNQVILGLL